MLYIRCHVIYNSKCFVCSFPKMISLSHIQNLYHGITKYKSRNCGLFLYINLNGKNAENVSQENEK